MSGATGTMAPTERPTFIWSLPDLLACLQHPSSAVQEWAASSLLKLYPEAAGQALQHLPQVSPGAASYLVDSLVNLPLPQDGLEPLHQLLQGEAEPHDKARAAALLLRHGWPLSEETLAALPMDGVLDDLSPSEPGFQYLLQQYRSAREPGESPVHALAHGCGAADLYHGLDDTSGKERRRSVKTLEKLWHCKLPDVSRVKDRGQALRLLREAVDATGHADGSIQSRFPTLVAQVRRDRERITTVLEAAEVRSAGDRPPAGEGEIVLLLACTLASYRDTACLEGLSSRSKAAELLRYLVIRPWQDEEVDPDLAALLGSQDPDELLSNLRNALSSEWTYARYAFRLLQALKIPGRHRLFQEKDTEEAEQVMLKDPEAMAALLSEWGQNPPDSHRVDLLGEYPTEEVVRFLLEHFEAYMSRPFSRPVIETMQKVASSRFLEPLVEEWREGEVAIGNAVRFLAQVHGMEADARVRHIMDMTEDYEGLLESIQDPDSLMERLEQRPVPLPLRCTVCKRTYHYQLERVYIGKRLEDMTIGQIVRCKGCGSLESYEITQEMWQYLYAELARLRLLGVQQEDGERPDTPLIPTLRPVKIDAAGKSFNSFSEAYHYLVKAVERDPENAELHRRLGNVLGNGLQPDLALPCYQEAVRLDPGDVEAMYSLAVILMEQGRYREAIPHVDALVPLCRDTDLDEDLGRSLFGSLIEMAADLEEETGHRVQFFPPAGGLPDIAGKRPNKKGRNEPVTLELFDLDLGEPEDFQRAYELFRHGGLPGGSGSEEWTATEDEPLLLSRPAGPSRRGRKTGRNEPCPCGSGKKYKRCCGR